MTTYLILFVAWLVAIIFYLRWRIRKGWNDELAPPAAKAEQAEDNAILDWWKEQNKQKLQE